MQKSADIRRNSGTRSEYFQRNHWLLRNQALVDPEREETNRTHGQWQ